MDHYKYITYTFILEEIYISFIRYMSFQLLENS
jgi:hypothetical protein